MVVVFNYYDGTTTYIDGEGMTWVIGTPYSPKTQAINHAQRDRDRSQYHENEQAKEEAEKDQTPNLQWRPLYSSTIMSGSYLPPAIQALIISLLPWEEYADLLLPLYPHALIPWSQRTYVDIDRTHCRVNGVYHSLGDLPALVHLHKNGFIFARCYYKNGLLHRDGDLPALINYHPDGSVFSQDYYINGQHHRDGDLPTSINYHPDGTISFQGYYKDGQRHRDGDLPESIQYRSDGSIFLQYYYKNGRPYRL